jgi:hypothetical protein
MLYITLILIAAGTVIIRAAFKLKRIKEKFTTDTLEVRKQAERMGSKEK